MLSDSATVASLAMPPSQAITSSSPSTDTSPAVSPSEEIVTTMSSSRELPQRPALSNTRRTGSIIVSREEAENIVDEEMDEHDMRRMSPRRNSVELQKLSEDARRDLMEQARLLQTSLQAIVQRVETVREEHERLEGGNKFLQSYIGELMSTSKITATAPSKKKGKGR